MTILYALLVRLVTMLVTTITSIYDITSIGLMYGYFTTVIFHIDIRTVYASCIEHFKQLCFTDSISLPCMYGAFRTMDI